jgi:hypothetical protein
LELTQRPIPYLEFGFFGLQPVELIFELHEFARVVALGLKFTQCLLVQLIGGRLFRRPFGLDLLYGRGGFLHSRLDAFAS